MASIEERSSEGMHDSIEADMRKSKCPQEETYAEEHGDIEKDKYIEQKELSRRHRLVALVSSLIALIVVGVLVSGAMLSGNSVIEESVVEANNRTQASGISEKPTSRTSSNSGDKEKVNPNKEKLKTGAKENSETSSSVTSGQEPCVVEPNENFSNPIAGTSANAGNTSQGSTSSDSAGNTNNNPTWMPGWDEQVWVDTSGYQSIYVGENPTYMNTTVCTDCGSTGVSGEHLLSTGHSGYRSMNVQVGTTPVYENQWIESGYYETVHHEGYWK